MKHQTSTIARTAAAVIAALAALSPGPSGSAFAASACDAAAPPAIVFEQARGVRTKWLTLTQDARNTIEPDLEGLPLAQWMQNLEAIGANLAEINLEPRRLLAARPAVPDADLMHAVAAFYTPASQLDPAWHQQVSNFVHDLFPHRRYTPTQRDAVLLDFLQRLEALRRHGEIAGSVRFIMHQRLWLPQTAPPEGRESRAGQFVDDMAGMINLAERNCLGHWLAGVRLGENSNTDMNQLLPLLVEMAERIDGATGGWLKTHLLLANGGGWGAEYHGVGQVKGADGQPFAFLPRMAAATGGFAFGYKWMQFHDQIANGIHGHMAAAMCAGGRRCDPNSVADWTTYLGTTLGGNDLIDFIAANHSRYPAVANVVFVGDSSDSVMQMVRVGADGRLSDGPELTAVRQLLRKAGPAASGGKVFMNAYDTVKVQTWRREEEGADVGRMLYLVDPASGQSHPLPQSKHLWTAWPGG